MGLERKKGKGLSENKAGNQDARVFTGGSSWSLHFRPNGWGFSHCWLLSARTCEASLFSPHLLLASSSLISPFPSKNTPNYGHEMVGLQLLSSLVAFTLCSPASQKCPVGKDWWANRARWFPNSTPTPHSPGSIRRAHFESSKIPLEGSVFLLKTKL